MAIRRFRVRAASLSGPKGGLLAMVVVMLVALAGASPASGSGARGAALAAPPSQWQETPAQLIWKTSYCFDQHTPYVIAINGHDWKIQRTYNWRTGQITELTAVEEQDRAAAACNVSGLYFSGTWDSVAGRYEEVWRYNLADSSRRKVERFADILAQDGTLQVYSRDKDGGFWASADGGLTWIDRSAQLPAGVADLVVADADARMLYAIARDSAEPGSGYRLYASQDAGASWELRAASPHGSARLELPKGRATPATTLILHADGFILTSDDGGKTFYEEGGLDFRTTDVYFAHSREGLLQMTSHKGGASTLELSRDGGDHWELLTTLPPPPARSGDSGYPGQPLSTAPGSPQTVIYNNGEQQGYSLDGGRTWQISHGLPHLQNLQVSPYLPLTMIGTQYSGKPNPTHGPEISYTLHVKSLPVEAAALTVPGLPSGSPRHRFFPQKGQEMADVFIDFWEAKGGLAQFGYPLTPAFREVSPSDGRLYSVQYFERNRFEYHPEHRGTPEIVQLGLLGSQLTADRRAEPAFQPEADSSSDRHCTFYAETRHRLCHAFQGYWNAHGGLAVYGYPISAEFEENGLVVQYFERARFEWHPEHQGTPYAVQLGLLGDELLRAKVWP